MKVRYFSKQFFDFSYHKRSVSFFYFFFQAGDGGDGIAFLTKAHEDDSLGVSAKVGNIFEGELNDLGLAGGQNHLVDGFINGNATDYFSGFSCNRCGFDALAASFLQRPAFDAGPLT